MKSFYQWVQILSVRGKSFVHLPVDHSHLKTNYNHMKAVVFHSPANIQVDTIEDPKLENDRGIILKVPSTAICGSDLHILSGAVP